MNGKQKIQKAYEAILNHDFEQAIDWFEQAINLEPNNAAYHYKLSITYARSNKLTLALKHAEQARQIDSSKDEYRFHLKHLKAKQLIYKAERYFDHTEAHLRIAISLLQQARTMDPLAAEAFLLMGLAYAELKEFDRASAAINEVLKLDPQHDIAKKLILEYESKRK